MEIIMRPAWLFCFILITATACHKDAEEPAPAAPTVIRFGGITLTDPNGVPLSDPDPDDWRMNVNWNSREEKLFASAAKNICGGQEESLVAAFPNPASGVVGLTIRKMKQAFQAEMRIVDRNYQVLRAIGPLDFNNASPDHSLILQVDDLGIVNDTVRLYYRLDQGSCEFRGYGDIVIK